MNDHTSILCTVAKRISFLMVVGAAAFFSSLGLHAALSDFTVESPVDGKTLKLSDAQGKYVALHFPLKTECPFCLKHTRDYAKKSATTSDVIQVFLKLDRFSYEQFAAKLAELKNQPAAAIQHYNLGVDRIALGGYDPVSYFAENQALKGRKEISARHRGVTYYFASEENKKLFTESREKYVPTYGGWCATAMAKGEKVEIDPTNFKITNGRLFLFYKGLWGNALKDWNKDEASLTAKADTNWKKIAGE